MATTPLGFYVASRNDYSALTVSGESVTVFTRQGRLVFLDADGHISVVDPLTESLVTDYELNIYPGVGGLFSAGIDETNELLYVGYQDRALVRHSWPTAGAPDPDYDDGRYAGEDCHGAYFYNGNLYQIGTHVQDGFLKSDYFYTVPSNTGFNANPETNQDQPSYIRIPIHEDIGSGDIVYAGLARYRGSWIFSDHINNGRLMLWDESQSVIRATEVAGVGSHRLSGCAVLNDVIYATTVDEEWLRIERRPNHRNDRYYNRRTTQA